MSEIQDRALGWEEEISAESEFILLPEGDYKFVVESIEKGYFNGSDKMSPCPMAILNLLVDDQVKIKANLFLNTKSEWKLSEFFIAIGLKKKGEPTKMRWNEVKGKTGVLTLKQKEWNENMYNEVKKFLEPNNENNNPANNWVNGKF